MRDLGGPSRVRSDEGAEADSLPEPKVKGLALGRPRWRHVNSAAQVLLNARASVGRVRRFQHKKLGEILRYAGREIPFYRDLFARHGIDPTVREPSSVLAQLPLLSKLNLREEPRERLMRPGARIDGLLPERSSGSTGIKLFLWRDPFEAHLLQLVRMRAWRLSGIRMRDRLALLRGTFVWDTKPLGISRVRQTLGVYRTREVSSMQPMEALIQQLENYGPDVLMGYPSVIHELAGRVAQQPNRRLRPRIVSTGGEMLSGGMRSTIEETFGVRVLDTYGAMEFNLLAWQCPHSDFFHVADDAVHLEVVSGGRAVSEGELGEVVVTGLHSYTFPLIRYRMGDLAVKGPDQCPCGAPFSTLRAVRGRTMEYFYATDGTSIHHWTLAKALLEPIRNARHRYQFVQKEADLFVLRIVLSRPLLEEERLQLFRTVAVVLGEDMRFELEVEDDIPLAASGKMVQSVNLYRSPWLGQKWDPAEWDRWKPGGASSVEGHPRDR